MKSDKTESDVTYYQVWWHILRIRALHLTHPKCTHTDSSEHTHTPWTHTQSSGQPFMLRRPGSSWGFGALLKGTSVVVLRVERALYIQPLTYNSYRPKTQTHNLWITSPVLELLGHNFPIIQIIQIQVHLKKVKPIYYIDSLHIEWNISSLYFFKFW